MGKPVKKRYQKPKITVQKLRSGIWGAGGRCLALGTKISSLKGRIAVERLKKNDLVWTVDARGNKMLQPIIRIKKTYVGNSHIICSLFLSDKRQISVSPLHPLFSEQSAVKDLKKGDIYNDAMVIKNEIQFYRSFYTFDILPAGESGAYFANGILLGSTLFRSRHQPCEKSSAPDYFVQ